MKILESTFRKTGIVAILSAFVFLTSCNNNNAKINISQDSEIIELNMDKDIIWHVKAYHPDGKLLDVKAITKDGKIHDVKVIQNSDQTSIMGVKAFVNGKILPVKVLVSEDEYLPVKAITADGTVIDIKALSSDGENLDLKAVRQSGNILHLNVIDENGEFYNIEAISPKGWIRDVKGIKMLTSPVEVVINGVEVYAHIKSVPQVNYQ
jgi:hypothetical protein